MEQLTGTIIYYNQHGEGVAFYNKKPVYIYGTIKGEEILYEIQQTHSTYYVGKLIKILKPSTNRHYHEIKDSHLIGGYDLIHMNDFEQRKFKEEKVLQDFKKIAHTNITEFDWIEGKQKTKYRNKITVHDGNFYQKNSNETIDIDDFLLSSIKWDKSLKGEVIYRKLDTLIYGYKYEKKYTFDSMFGYQFRIGLNSFYQVNKEVAILAYQYIIDNLLDNGITLDLYSGIGTISIIASNKSQKVIGVEINSDSYNDALYNKEINKIKNVDFYNKDVSSFIKEYKDSVDTLILDPPRSGVDKRTLNLIKDIIKPKRIIYMSCNPATQASNFNILKKDYHLSKIAVLDMFPQTYHIESIIVLDRNNQ